MTVRLYAHQEAGVATALANKRWGFWFQPGLGKTIMMLEVIDRLQRGVDRPSGKWLILAPLAVLETAWLKDAGRHYPHLQVRNLWRPSGRAVEAAISEPGWQVGLLNYEAYRVRPELLYRVGVRNLICDESSKLGKPDTKQTMAVTWLADRCDRVYCLSGCPAPNDETEYLPQLRIISPRAFSTGSRPMHYWAVRTFYFYQKEVVIKEAKKINGRLYKRGQKLKIGRPMLVPSKAEGFWNEVKRWSSSARKEDVLDMPEKVDLVRAVTLSDAEKRAYRDMWASLRLEVGDAVISAEGIAKIMKLRQITSGFVYHGDRPVVIGDAKIRAMEELLEGELADEQVVIWGSFQAEIERIAERIRCPYIHGEVPHAKRHEVIRGFADGAVRRLVAHPMAMGHGVDGLQVSAHQVFASLDYSYDAHNQARDRIHRIGQHRTCYYHYLVAPGTIDEHLYEVVTDKASRSDFGLRVLGMPGVNAA